MNLIAELIEQYRWNYGIYEQAGRIIAQTLDSSLSSRCLPSSSERYSGCGRAAILLTEKQVMAFH